MFTAETVENSLRYLYRGAAMENAMIQDSVDDLLGRLDTAALAAVFQREARKVCAYEKRECGILSTDFRGTELFPQRAVCLYESALSCAESHTQGLMEDIRFEVWMKEDGNLLTILCMALSLERGGHQTEYREIRGYPFGTGLDINLTRVTEELLGRYDG